MKTRNTYLSMLVKSSAFLTFTILLFGFAGCVIPTPTPTPTLTATATRTATITLTPTFTVTFTPSPTPTSTNTPTAATTPTLTFTPTPSPTPSLSQKFERYPWIAYAPTHYDPNTNVLPSLEAIAEDLRVLYDAGFRGIVTYSAGGIFGDIPRLAREAGFDGVVMGIWTPGDPDETLSAINAAPFIDGYVVGNEGIYFNRYDFATLEAAIRDLRQKTNKWVTTTEVISLYGDPNILGVGDWIFPNVHPYWQGIVDPLDAA